MKTTDKIQVWAEERNLIAGSTPQAQMVKLVEEVGELASGIAKKNLDVTIDSIGDACVVLSILALQHNTTLEQCMAKAYDEIKNRTGRMVDGVFIKEEDTK